MMRYQFKWGHALLMLGLLALTQPPSLSAWAGAAERAEKPSITSSKLDIAKQTEPPDEGYPPPTEVLPDDEEQTEPAESPTAYPPPATTEIDPFGVTTLEPDIFAPAEEPGELPPPPDAQVEEGPQPGWLRNTLILWVGFVGGLLVLSGGIFASILLYSRRKEQ